MKTCHRLSVSLLACLALLLPACTPQATAEAEAAPAMGRYVEEAFPLPADILSVRALELDAEECFTLIGETAAGSLTALRSADGGASWQPAPSPWGDTAPAGWYAMALDGKGGLWYTLEVPDDTINQLYESGDEEAIAAYEPPLYPLYSVAGGAVADHDIALTTGSNNVQSILVRGGRVAASYGGSVAVYNLETGATLVDAEADRFRQPGDYVLAGDTLALVDSGKLALYDLETGSLSAELPLQEAAAGQAHGENAAPFDDDNTAVAATGEEGVFAYCNPSGIYRASAGGLPQERIVSGDMTSLSSPTTVPQLLFAGDNAYYVFATDPDSKPWQISGGVILRYRYDSAVPAFPSQELRLFALSDSPTARLAIERFHRENPDTLVSFEIWNRGDSLLYEDMLRVLTTELLAGKGPDVLLLDGLPLNSYVEKGILADLNAILSPGTKERIFASLLDCYGNGDAFYALPLRFTMPMILGERTAADAVPDLHGLAEMAGSMASPQLGLKPAELLDLLFPSTASGWLGTGDRLDQAAAARGLKDLKDLLALYDGKENLWNTGNDIRFGAVGWLAGWTPCYVHRLTSFEQLCGPYTAGLDGNAVYELWEAGGEGGLAPTSVVGVSAAGDSEKAAKLVECMLADEVQAKALEDGMPVNREAARSFAANPWEEDAHHYGTSFLDEFDGNVEKMHNLPLAWPDAAYFDRFFSYVDAAPVAKTLDSGILVFLREEVEAYLLGDKGLDDTVVSMKQRTDLILAEQAG